MDNGINEGDAYVERDGSAVHIGLTNGMRVSFRDKGKRYPAGWAESFVARYRSCGSNKRMNERQ